MARILLVEDDSNACKVMAIALQGKGHQVVTAGGLEEAETCLHQGCFDIVLTDLRMDGRNAGLEVVQSAVQLQPKAKVLLITAYASAETAVAAMRMGAFDYLTKPVSSEDLEMAIERALSLRPSGPGESEELKDVDPMLVGSSIVMQRLRERLRRIAEREFTVLITGESGTGKELAAKFIHQHSKRARGPFVPVHCGAIPFDLFEAELFGFRKGSFTGATHHRQGLIEAADGGTLFLDEVGEMPPTAQVKLLRVLQDHRVRHIGEDRERAVDVRIIAATNRDLLEETRKGRFREDLFYRLNVIPIRMPPLRERPEDIPELVQHILKRSGSSNVRITDACMRRLSHLPYPGNVRELENMIHRMLAIFPDGVWDEAVLDEACGVEDVFVGVDLDAFQEEKIGLDEWLQQLEIRLIRQALAKSKGNMTEAAKALGISFRSLRYRMRKLGLRK